MVGLAARIAYLKHQVPGELALDGKAPLLDGGREHSGIDPAGLIGGAGRKLVGAAAGRHRGSLIQRNQRKETARSRGREQLLASVGRWIGIGAVAEVVQEIVQY